MQISHGESRKSILALREFIVTSSASVLHFIKSSKHADLLQHEQQVGVMFQQTRIKLLSSVYGFAHPSCQHQLLYSYQTKETRCYLQYIDQKEPCFHNTHLIEASLSFTEATGHQGQTIPTVSKSGYDLFLVHIEYLTWTAQMYFLMIRNVCL